jgi:virginiamycin B lyase
MADPGPGASTPFPRLVPILAALGVVVVVAAVLLFGRAGAPSPTGSATPTSTPTLSAGGSPTTSPAATGSGSPATSGSPSFTVETFPVPAGSHPHDVAPAADGGVWYTAQTAGKLGHLDPATGDVREVALGKGSAPHGVVVGPDGVPWVTDQGLEAIVRVDPGSGEVTTFPMPAGAPAVSPHTPTFAPDGNLWFTGQAGQVGRLDPATGEVRLFPAPGGAGPYGITTTPAGDVYFASLQRSYLGMLDRVTGDVTVLEPPTADSGVRRCWSDSGGRIWVSEWNVGQVGVYDPADGSWREWKLPGDGPMAYSVFVDDQDIVWLTEFGADAIVRFDPTTERFQVFPLDGPAQVRQMDGRPGEAWGAESAADRLVVVRTGS